MSISELLPGVRALPKAEKLQLIQILAEDLAESEAPRLAGEYPVWTPIDADEAAEVLRAALDDAARRNEHA